MTSPSSPTGPLACIFEVLIPTSAPFPYLNPSANLVEAFHITDAESTRFMNLFALALFSVIIASVCFDPCLLMWLIASSKSSTILTDKIKSLYSISQFFSVAWLILGTTFLVSSSPLISTPAVLNFLIIKGRNFLAIPLCTNKVSTALHTAGYWHFASKLMLIAFFKSASLSTYTWHIPSECPSTGIWEFFMMYLTKALLPLGMTKSI